MKKFLLSFFALMLLVAVSEAQEPAKAFKAAKKAYGIYTLDQENKADKLTVAKENIDLAISGIKNVEQEDQSKMWAMMGSIYNSISVNDMNMSLVDPTYKIDGNTAYSGYTGFKNALETANKKWEKKDALAGLLEAANHLNTAGSNQYQNKDFAGAYKSFYGVIETHDILEKNGNKSTLQTEEDYNDMLFAAGLCAYSAEMLPEAKPIFEKLADANYNKPSVYEVLYKAYAGEDEAKAIEMLEKGRKAFPDDVGLLFAEINHYLKNNKLNELTSKLKTAIEKEPENVTLYTTLGNVYDNLYQRESKEGTPEKQKEYFDLAMDYYSQALEKDDKSFDAIYSIGALHYNKAAAISTELVALESDYSKEGMRKYKAKEAEVYAAFDQALPYFQKSEGLNPSDRNTLIALKEIFAKKNDIPTSTEFKNRLETLDAGGTIESSYFDK